MSLKCQEDFISIEKCSSPIGDGNITNSTPIVPPVIIEKCSSPIGDGNTPPNVLSNSSNIIVKRSSPIGDGNSYSNLETVTFGNKVDCY